MKSARWIFSAILLSGCVYQVIDLPVASNALESQTIRPIARDELSMMRSGNLIVVNRMEDFCRDVLVFNGHHSLDELIVRGSDGLPAIDYYNIGRFNVVPASGGSEPMYGEILIGTFMKDQQFTFLITTQSARDGCRKVLCEPQVYHGQIRDRPLGERYSHPVGGIMVEEMVYNIAVLPDANINYGRANIISNALSIDELLRRGLHKSQAK
jgi:hypothetical protein